MILTSNVERAVRRAHPGVPRREGRPVARVRLSLGLSPLSLGVSHLSLGLSHLSLILSHLSLGWSHLSLELSRIPACQVARGALSSEVDLALA